MNIFRIMAEFSDGAVINDSVSAADHDAARQILNERIKRALSLVGQELIVGSDKVALESVITTMQRKNDRD